MLEATVDHVWMRATSVAPKTEFLQELEVFDGATASLTVSVESAKYVEAGSSTLTARVQVSNDRANWRLVNEGSPDVSIQVVATGAGQVAGSSQGKPELPVAGWKWMRVYYLLTTNLVESNVDVILSAELNVERPEEP